MLFTTHGENAIVQLPQFVDVIQSGKANSYTREADFRGRKVWFAITNTPLGEDRLVHTWEDITQRKKAEQELSRLQHEAVQKATDTYRTLFNSIDEGVTSVELMFDQDGQVVDFVYLDHNPALTRQTSDIIGQRVSQIAPSDESRGLCFCALWDTDNG